MSTPAPVICYEIVNPSDHATFLAPDRDIALAVVTLISEGMYAARCLAVDGQPWKESAVGPAETLDVPFFIGDDSYESWWRARGYAQEPLTGILKDRRPEVAAALRSVAYCTLDDRLMYDAACAAITDPDKLAAFKQQHEDRKRSSFNRIVQRAWTWADRIERSAAA